jgi:hypothetical protein
MPHKRPSAHARHRVFPPRNHQPDAILQLRLCEPRHAWVVQSNICILAEIESRLEELRYLPPRRNRSCGRHWMQSLFAMPLEKAAKARQTASRPCILRGPLALPPSDWRRPLPFQVSIVAPKGSSEGFRVDEGAGALGRWRRARSGQCLHSGVYARREADSVRPSSVLLKTTYN